MLTELDASEDTTTYQFAQLFLRYYGDDDYRVGQGGRITFPTRDPHFISLAVRLLASDELYTSFRIRLERYINELYLADDDDRFVVMACTKPDYERLYVPEGTLLLAIYPVTFSGSDIPTRNQLFKRWMVTRVFALSKDDGFRHLRDFNPNAFLDSPSSA